MYILSHSFASVISIYPRIKEVPYNHIAILFFPSSLSKQYFVKAEKSAWGKRKMGKKKGGKPFFGVDAAIVVKDKTKEGEGDKKTLRRKGIPSEFYSPCFPSCRKRASSAGSS